MCSIFNLTGCIMHFLPWWLPYAFYGVIALFILGVFVKIKELFGWPGMLASYTVLCLGVGILIDRHWKQPKKISEQNSTISTSIQHAPIPMTKRPVYPPKSIGL